MDSLNFEKSFNLLRKLYGELSEEEQSKFRVTDWTITEVTVTGDSATVDFTFDKVKKGQLSLRRYGEVWKVEQRRTF